MAFIRGVLIDLGGVVYQGKAALPGSIEAIRTPQGP
jgi:ribonucleotide monophosphatase NagD (HAD superfamily)